MCVCMCSTLDRRRSESFCSRQITLLGEKSRTKIKNRDEEFVDEYSLSLRMDYILSNKHTIGNVNWWGDNHKHLVKRSLII